MPRRNLKKDIKSVVGVAKKVGKKVADWQKYHNKRARDTVKKQGHNAY